MIALVGDHNPAVTAHAAIPRALELARRSLGINREWRWIGTNTIGDPRQSLAGATGIWVVPASPYVDMAGALAAIRHARERHIPFLGTCGGFQHAIIEFARDVAQIADADHAETAGKCHQSGDTAPGPPLVITPLSCSLVEKSGEIIFQPGSRLDAIFGGKPTVEGYHCNYGVNPAHRAALEAAGLRFTGFDRAGDIRACELPSHPFFVGTLFQPERAALRDASHPLVEAFLRASV